MTALVQNKLELLFCRIEVHKSEARNSKVLAVIEVAGISWTVVAMTRLGIEVLGCAVLGSEIATAFSASAMKASVLSSASSTFSTIDLS